MGTDGELQHRRRRRGEYRLPGPQGDWFELLGKQVERYTMGESSSVSMETARELLASMRFCIDMRRRVADTGEEESLQEQLEAGIREVWRLTEDTKVLYATVRRTVQSFDNRACEDTLREIEGFFRAYDYRFFAHQIPCIIDYPLSRPVPEELCGIEYIRDYLGRLLVESRFCSLFDGERVRRLLRAYYVDYKDLHVNLFEPVFANAIGLFLLGGDPRGLSVSERQGEYLFLMFHPWKQKRASGRIKNAVPRLCDYLEIEERSMRAYLLACARDLLPRMRTTAHASWGNLFPAI